MYTQKNEKKKSCLTCLLFLVLFLLVLAVAGGISLNLIREGQPGFLANLIDNNSNQAEPADQTAGWLPVPEHVKTIVLLGSDFRPESGFRTDVILLVAYNLQTGQVNMLSFPRDLWVNIPGWQYERINTAVQVGGFDLLGDTMQVNFGFRPDHYAMVDFNGFKKIINLLGGIDVHARQPMEDQCEFNSERWCYIEEGVQYMDAEKALWYVRARYNSSDFDRTRRAQEVVSAIFKKAISPSSIMNMPLLIGTISTLVESDSNLVDLWYFLVPFNKFTQEDNFNSFTLTPNEAMPWMTDGGASVLLPNYPLIEQILYQVLWINNP